MDKENVISYLLENRIIFLSQNIDSDLANHIISNLIFLNKKNSKKEITLLINSNGGEIEGGMLSIYDTIQNISPPVKTICIGTAYSAAAVILAGGTKGKRYAYEHASIMIHSAQLDNLSGSLPEIEEEIKRIKKLNDSMMQILSKHSGQLYSKILKDCKNDKYFSSKEALDYGLIDKIIQPDKFFEKLLK